MRRTDYLIPDSFDTVDQDKRELPENLRQNVVDTLKWFCFEHGPEGIVETVSELFSRTPHCRLLKCELDDEPTHSAGDVSFGSHKSTAVETPFFSEVSDLRASIIQLTIRGWSGLPGDPKLNLQLSVNVESEEVWKTVYGDIIEYSELWDGIVVQTQVQSSEETIRSEGYMKGFEPVISGVNDEIELGFEKMVSEMVHEVRNPLGSIMTAVGLVNSKAGEPIEEEDCQLLTMIESESERIDRILRNFVESIRPIPMKKEKADIQSLVIESLRESVFVDDDLVDSLEIFGDKCQSEIDVNLMRGMFDYLSQDIPESMVGCSGITFESSIEDNELKMEFRYSGDGIRPDLLRKVVLPSNAAKDGGSGLKEIPPTMVVMAHNGRMKVHSEDSTTVLTMWLPIPENG